MCLHSWYPLFFTWIQSELHLLLTYYLQFLEIVSCFAYYLSLAVIDLDSHLKLKGRCAFFWPFLCWGYTLAIQIQLRGEKLQQEQNTKPREGEGKKDRESHLKCLLGHVSEKTASLELAVFLGQASVNNTFFGHPDFNLWFAQFKYTFSKKQLS